MVQVILELGQLTGAEHGIFLDHEWGVLLGISLTDVQVEHPGDQGTLQARPCSAEHVETRAGDLHPLLEVQDVQCGSQIPVGFRLEVEFGDLTHTPQHHVLTVILPVGRARIRDVGDTRQDGIQLFLGSPQGIIELADVLPHAAHRFDLCLPLSRVLGFPNFLRHSIALGFEALRLLDGLAALAVQLQDLVDRCRVILAVCQGFSHHVGLLTDYVDI